MYSDSFSDFEAWGYSYLTVYPRHESKIIFEVKLKVDKVWLPGTIRHDPCQVLHMEHAISGSKASRILLPLGWIKIMGLKK